MSVLAVPDDLGRVGGLALARAAQLADDPLPRAGIDVNLLARQRCTPTVRAAVPVGLERPETAAQQHDLELLYVS